MEHISFFNSCFVEKCPAGYELKIGDEPGWGTDLGSRLSLSLQECADECSKKTACLSFEQSSSNKLCNLNRVAKPKNQGPYKDFVFCMKQKSMKIVWVSQ